MKNKEKKKYLRNLAQENLDRFFSLLEKRFNPKYDKFYIKEIKKISQSFNIRLKREDKLKFCRNCDTFFNTQTREIRFKNGFKEVICKNCKKVRRYGYK